MKIIVLQLKISCLKNESFWIFFNCLSLSLSYYLSHLSLSLSLSVPKIYFSRKKIAFTFNLSKVLCLQIILTISHTNKHTLSLTHSLSLSLSLFSLFGTHGLSVSRNSQGFDSGVALIRQAHNSRKPILGSPLLLSFLGWFTWRDCVVNLCEKKQWFGSGSRGIKWREMQSLTN